MACLLYTSDAADERSSVDLGGRRIIKKKKHKEHNLLGTISHTAIKTHDAAVDMCERDTSFAPTLNTSVQYRRRQHV